jgi:hypothetical protein
LVETLRKAEALSDIVAYQFPATRWRRYDKVGRLPGGLVVTGDALCSLSPVNAQGLTAAALEARALRDALATGRPDFTAQFFVQTARLLSVPWGMAAEPGKPANLAQRIQGAMTARLMAAAATEPAVAAQLIRVLALLDPPSKLMRPSVLGRAMLPWAAR